MKITVFTGNQPRHISLIAGLAGIADEVFAVQECRTVFPGEVEDLYKNSVVMREYFGHVIEAERSVFGGIDFLPRNVRSMSIRSDDINRIGMKTISKALESDHYVVFGGGYIKGALIDFLIGKRAINIHMGLSPYYRGSNCNFWALYDGQPDYVGATIHLLSKGLDSGPILFHAVPEAWDHKAFLLGMRAVKSAHDGLLESIKEGRLSKMTPVPQDKKLEIRYSRNTDFNDKVVAKYLKNIPSENEIRRILKDRDHSLLVRPYIG